MIAYAGIGSRETPEPILVVMRNLAATLLMRGFTLRTGCAPGADQAFAQHGSGEWYLPWPEFERRWVKKHAGDAVIYDRATPAAYEIAAEHHPVWHKLSRGAQALHARNSHQILGHDIDNPVLSRFVVCWTKGGGGQGGTGQALRLAQHFEVPVFDLGVPSVLERIVRSLR